MRKALVNSSFVKKLKQYIKLRVTSKHDVQSAEQVLPPGIDANPVKDMMAIICDTGVSGEKVVLGYIHKNAIAEKGEFHCFSTNEQGEEQIRFKLKKDGTAELGGNSDSLLRFSPLNTALNSYNTAVIAEFGKIATAISSLGGTYAPGTLSIDISAAKIEELKSS